MPDVSILNWHQPYIESSLVPQQRDSALEVMLGVLSLRGSILPGHLKELVKIALWKWTEADGSPPYAKFNLRFVSRGVLESVGPVSINHEHVQTKKSLVRSLLSRDWKKDELRNFLATQSQACVVTVPEHALLSASNKEAWARYLDAQIDVWDRKAEQWIDIASMTASPVEMADRSIAHRSGHRSREPSTVARPHAAPTVSSLIESRCKPSVRPLLQKYLRTIRFCMAAPAEARKIGPDASYFQVYDALSDDPGPAVAYVHWTGRVAFRIGVEDLPPALAAAAHPLQDAQYGVSCGIAAPASLEVAEDLLFLALEKARATSHDEV